LTTTNAKLSVKPSSKPEPANYVLFESDEEAMAFAEEMAAIIMKEIDEAEEAAGAPYPFWRGGEEDVKRWKEGRWGQKD
jgi:hypothetical protein